MWWLGYPRLARDRARQFLACCSGLPKAEISSARDHTTARYDYSSFEQSLREPGWASHRAASVPAEYRSVFLPRRDSRLRARQELRPRTRIWFRPDDACDALTNRSWKVLAMARGPRPADPGFNPATFPIQMVKLRSNERLHLKTLLFWIY